MRGHGKFPGHSRQYAWLAAVLLPLSALGQAEKYPDDLASAFERTTIIIEARKDACYRFDVYLARSREQRRRGLMHVRYLPEFSGMLFIYKGAEMLSMWMKNTYVPLDILFIREDGTISSIEANTEPLSLESITSTEPVVYVLELNAGVSARLGIDTNSRVYLR